MGNKFNRIERRSVGLVLGPLLFLALLLLPPPQDLSPAAWHVVAVAALMATWWISEAIPLAATALLPIVLFPLLDVMPTSTTTTAAELTCLWIATHPSRAKSNQRIVVKSSPSH